MVLHNPDLNPESLSINGVFLEDVVEGVRTLSVVGRELLSNTVETRTINGITRFEKQYQNPRTVSVTVFMEAASSEALVEKYNKMNAWLNFKEAKLKFNDEFDKYYIATKSETGNPPQGVLKFTTSYTILIPDPLKYADYVRTITPTVDPDTGILTASIDNQGTAPAILSYKVKFNSDNGYVGIVSEDGVMQYGSVAETDGSMVETPKSKLLGAYSAAADWTAWQAGTTNAENSNKKCNMTLDVDTDVFGSTLGRPTGSMQTTGIASGGLRYVNFEASRNIYLWFRFWFETGRMGQTGTSSLNLVAEDGSLICSLIVEKQDKSGNTATAILKVGGNNPKQYQKFTFQPTHWAKNNPLTWIDGGGVGDIRKEGSKITIFWWGRYYSITVPELENVKASRLELYVGQWNGRNLTNAQLVDQMKLRRISITQLNVPEWKDNPNKFASGDELYIDGLTKRAALNGIMAQDIEVRGTSYFKAPVGDSEIEFYYSDFATNVEITVELREVWL